MPRLTFTNTLGANVSIGNADGYGKSIVIPSGGATVDLTGVQLESNGPQMEALKAKGYISWVTTENPNIDNDLEILSNVARLRAISTGSVPAKSATAVHASVFGDAVGPVALTTGLTNPTYTRNVTAVAGTTYDGGAVTVTGTNTFDLAQTEVITPVVNTTVAGVKIWKTVTKVAYPGGGVGTHGTNTLSIGTGDKLGVPHNIFDTVGLLLVGTTPEAVTIDAANDAFTPTTTPASTTYLLLANVAS